MQTALPIGLIALLILVVPPVGLAAAVAYAAVLANNRRGHKSTISRKMAREADQWAAQPPRCDG